MENSLREAMEAKTRELIAAPTCSSETKEAAERWLSALGTEARKRDKGRRREILRLSGLPDSKGHLGQKRRNAQINSEPNTMYGEKRGPMQTALFFSIYFCPISLCFYLLILSMRLRIRPPAAAESWFMFSIRMKSLPYMLRAAFVSSSLPLSIAMT